jgi:hypothetical protein
MAWDMDRKTEAAREKNVRGAHLQSRVVTMMQLRLPSHSRRVKRGIGEFEGSDEGLTTFAHSLRVASLDYCLTCRKQGLLSDVPSGTRLSSSLSRIL